VNHLQRNTFFYFALTLYPNIFASAFISKITIFDICQS